MLSLPALSFASLFSRRNGGQSGGVDRPFVGCLILKRMNNTGRVWCGTVRYVPVSGREVVTLRILLCCKASEWFLDR